jgi:polar amino acid transport system substrate-binding protein
VRTRRASLLAVVVLVALSLASCSETGDESVFAPATTQPPAPTTAVPEPPTQECSDTRATLASYPVLESMPSPGGAMPAGSWMAEIKARGRLIAGVSADTLLFGARNPLTGELEGFDIDVVKQVAIAIFGVPDDGDVDSLIEYRVINYAQRLPSLESGEVDIVAHTMTINCRRWQRIAFSTEYFDAGQKVLVRTDNGAQRVEDLGGQRICVAEGSTNLDNIKEKAGETDPKIVVVAVPDVTDCLVQFQQGAVDGITGDDTVLAGFVAQDPYAKVLPDKFSSEPYGLGISLAHPEFVRFVNGVLERVRADEWSGFYDRWIGDRLGPRPAGPPQPDYGRPLP